MARQSDAFIDLDRTFTKILMDGDISDDTDLSSQFGRRGNLLWSDLLNHHRVVLLSEAGSGKTAEIRNATRRLRAEGKTAFLLRIENVMTQLEDAFEEGGTYDEFERWLSSDTEGWLLLDSVDEARLGDPREFANAIRKLGRLTKFIRPKAHIIITGRSTAWRAVTDLETCQQAFEFDSNLRQALPSEVGEIESAVQTTPSETGPDASFLVVTLNDIHGDQIDRFLKATGVKDAKEFRTAVERKEAESLTTRPLDFLELVDFWHEHHRIGTRFELMKSSIDRRLVERDQNRAEFRPIAPGRLREGVRLLAAATTLGQTAAISVPDGDANKKGIPVRSVLIGWDDAEVGALLSRPIFEPGIYGTVRFHHRTVREYLAAEWLNGLIRNFASRVKIENLFFLIQYGVQVINPSLRPVLPWLAIMDERIESLSSDDEKAKFAMVSLIAVVGSRTASRCRQNYKAVEHAKALYLLMHRYVRIADDIDRTGGGVYSPGLRDDAQHARDGLLAIIRETPGKASFLALQEIAQAHPAESLRPWSAFYAHQKATADAQTPPWGPDKVIDFHNNLESTPSTHRELWNLAVDRLLDLKHDLEDGDSSYAEILLKTSQETAIRKFIGNWLRDRAAGRYVVPQEEQLADDKRPDFRIQNSDFYEPVPVELKLSQNWSGPAHFERLENQLCGDYLRGINSSCGIFLLVNHGGQAAWASLSNDLVNFEGLVTALQNHWLAIAPQFPNVEDIKVIGIDLVKRGGQAAAKAVEKNRAMVNQPNE